MQSTYTAGDTRLRDSAPDERGRMPRRSAEKPLPVPPELQNAPWNRKDPVARSEPLQSVGNSALSPEDNLTAGLATLSVNERTVPLAGIVSNERPDVPDSLTSSSVAPSDASIRPALNDEDNRLTPFVTPQFEQSQSNDLLQPFVQAEVKKGVQTVYSKPLVVENASKPPDLRGIVDLTNTEDTTVHKRVAPSTFVHYHYPLPNYHPFL